MSDRTIEMLIVYQRIETGIQIVLVIALFAAFALTGVSYLWSDRLRSPGKVITGGLLPLIVAIACFTALPLVRQAHWDERDRALAEDRRAHEIEFNGAEMNVPEPWDEQSSSENDSIPPRLQSGVLRPSTAATR